ncbi:MAG: TetR family transcriptional regulator [Pseudomonadota bacterium]
MSTRAEHRDEATKRIARHLLRTGLAQTSLRQLAAAADVSDRMLLYYFSNKNDVLTSALHRVAAEMAEKLNASLPAHEKHAPAELLRRGAALTEARSFKPYMRISLEIAASAARGEEPYAGVSSEIIAGFLVWIEARLSAPDAKQRRREATMILAVIDGLSVMSSGVKPREAEGAVASFAALLERAE